MAQFAPYKSFVEIDFFVELGKFKLEKARLNEDSVAIYAEVGLPAAPNRPPAIRLSKLSFEDPPVLPESPLEFLLSGKLTTYNSMRRFVDLDKAEYLRTEVSALLKKIETGRVLENPLELITFSLITFADLKKHKFYYWFCFPGLSWRSKATFVPDTSSGSKLNEAIEVWLANQPQNQQVAFVLQKRRASETEKDTEFFWRIGRLAEIENFVGQEFVHLGILDFGTRRDVMPWHVHNFVALLSHLGISRARLYIFRDHPKVGSKGRSQWLEIDVDDTPLNLEGLVGWERNAEGKLSFKSVDVSAMTDPERLAEQSADLNLNLIKWRIASAIDLDVIKNAKCLLLGAGTLGCYVARGLMAWGVRHITFVDNGYVSYSNPVRQSLYLQEDCINSCAKAEAAARALKSIFPGVIAAGHKLDIPMVGHPIIEENRQRKDYDMLNDLIGANDVVFLLLDNRESRWLPTVIGQATEKIVINAAIGFDSYLVMRHGVPSMREEQRVGCYFCNDVVAPLDSVSNLTLDQMCTVTRPGVAAIASGYAVELFAAIMQSKNKASSPVDEDTVLGPVYHQLRGFLSRQELVRVTGQAFNHCSACSKHVVTEWITRGWSFVRSTLNDSNYLTEFSGLGKLQRQVDMLDIELETDSGDEVIV